MPDEDAILHIMQREASAVRPAREAAALARKMGDKQRLGKDQSWKECSGFEHRSVRTQWPTCHGTLSGVCGKNVCKLSCWKS